MPELRTIKLIVGGMTALIVIMLGLLIWGMGRNAAQVQEGLARLQQRTQPAWQAALPAGRILAVTPAGAHLAILAETPAGRVVYIYNPADSALIGTLRSESSGTDSITVPESGHQPDSPSP